MIKSLLKIIFIFILLPILGYVAFAFIEGGFGKKQPALLPVINPDMPLLFAHRGVTIGVPENSREAIELARKKGFKGLEVDIRKTLDNEFILFHDARTNRLLGQDTLIAALPLDRILQYQLLINQDTTKSRVITLKEMIETYQDEFIMYFDMKLGNLNDVDELIHLIWSNNISETVIVASPSVLVNLYIEYNYPVITTAMEGFNSGNEWFWYLIPKNLKPDYLSGFASKVDVKHIDWLSKHDLLSSRIVYGVDSTNYQAILDFGIKNMIIDYYPSLQVP
jgi:glycerophosphoryl diester phosphodiesterase